ncbi:hypothetical protein LTS18_005323 [Coniosporium uncinatum]|uniref:Uncharacterized protein n=1 Tax=Coniosporium uncinatum TaxID=93489 RepID=A0ACC3D4V5_9PEZI|nr:hypothetical protein LTS18_005323 [Coniosporium uncinatum]
MGATFFVGWALWQQMTFVLACSIVLVIGAGWLKVWHSHWRIKKYEELEKAGAGDVEAAVMVQRRMMDEEKDQVPFGIKALYSGIEVEGVWISRTNTPAPGSPVSSPATALLGGASGSGSHAHAKSLSNGADIPRLEMPQPVMSPFKNARPNSRGPHNFKPSSVTGERYTREASSSFLGASLLSDESSLHAGPSTYTGSYQQLIRPSSPSDNTSRVESSPEMHDRKSSDGSWSFSTTADPTSRKSSSGSDKTKASNSPIPSVNTRSLTDSSLVKPQACIGRFVDKRTDLDLLQTHRLSHVAETGQLTPRVRKPGNSGEWASIAQSNGKAPAQDYFAVPRRSSPSPLGDMPENPFATPTGSAGPFATPLPDRSSSYSKSQTMPLLEHQTPPTSPPEYTLSRRYEPSSLDLDFSSPRPLSEPNILNKVQQAQAQAQKTVHEQQQQEQQQQEQQQQEQQQQQRMSFQRPRYSGDLEVLRTVNQGFQILRPGTLPAVSVPKEPAKLQRKSRRTSASSTGSKQRASSFYEHGLSDSLV